ncbi:MAG TPA: PH domain-containing protein [Thermomicrobiales bacterium]|nr:PH domain-containing protein [Thermomicrobiales bacterium]
MRQSREQRGWDVTPTVELSRRFPTSTPPHETPHAPHDARLPGGAESVWQASASFGKLTGFLLALGALTLAGVSVWRFSAADGLPGVLALLAAVVCAGSAVGIIYLLRGLTTIRYVIGRDSLTIHWMNGRRVLPYDQIRDVVYEPRGRVSGRGYERFWPGYHVSTMQMRDGAWHSVATQAPSRRVRIVTRTGIHAISPHRPILFLGELARRRQYTSTGPEPVRDAPIPSPAWVRPAPTRHLEAAITPTRAQPERALPPTDERAEPAPSGARREPPTARRRQRGGAEGVAGGWLSVYRELFRERLLGDQVASGLVAAGVMIPLLMIAFLYSQYEGIGDIVPLHWNAHGDVDAAGTRRDLWRLPLIAALILILNTTMATVALAVDRFMARFLLAATLLAQAIAFVALIHAAT